MKHRVAAKGKNMYVLLGLLALLLGSLAYLGSQRGSREGLEPAAKADAAAKKANKNTADEMMAEVKAMMDKNAAPAKK